MLDSAQRAFAEHLCLPFEHRLMSLTEYADLIGVNLLVLDRWQLGGEFKRYLAQRERALKESPDFSAWAMRHRTKEALWQQFSSLTKTTSGDSDHTQIRNYAKQILDLTEEYELKDESVQYEEMTTDKLVELMMARDLAPVTIAEIEAAYIEEKPCKKPSRSRRASSPSASGSRRAGSSATRSASPKGSTSDAGE